MKTFYAKCKTGLIFLPLVLIGCGSGGGSEAVSVPPNNVQNLSENQTPKVLKAIDLFSVPNSVASAYFTVNGTDTKGDMSGFDIQLGMNDSDKCQSKGNVVPDCKLTIQGPLGGALLVTLQLSFSKLSNLEKSGTARYEFIFDHYRVKTGTCLVNGINPEYEISGLLYCELDFSHSYSEFQRKRSAHGFCSTDRNVEKVLEFNLEGKFHSIAYSR